MRHYIIKLSGWPGGGGTLSIHKGREARDLKFVLRCVKLRMRLMLETGELADIMDRVICINFGDAPKEVQDCVITELLLARCAAVACYDFVQKSYIIEASNNTAEYEVRKFFKR